MARTVANNRFRLRVIAWTCAALHQRFCWARTPVLTRVEAQAASDWPRDSALLQVQSPATKPQGKHAEPSVLLKKVSLADVGDDPLATCNDGSPGIFYWAEASPPSRNFLVLLGYGGWCWDAPSCELRSPDMRSSTVYARRMHADPDGILADTSFNRIWAPQCSSDAWMGDIGANESVAGVNWRGARIMAGIMRYLTSKRGLTDGDLLVFGGLSAGSRGAMVHLDRLKTHALVPQGVRLMGYLDSPYYVEMPPYKNNTDIMHRLETQTRQMSESLQNEAILRGSGACNLPEAWQCAFGELRLPILQTPYLVVASQYDWYGLIVAEASDMNLEHCFPDPQCSYYAYASKYARVVRRGLEKLLQASTGSVGVYSSTCYNHAQSLEKAHNKESVGNVSRADIFRQALKAFDSADAEMPRVIDTSCTGLNCGSGCIQELDPACGCELHEAELLVMEE